jgi:diguanylate cyclase (GGDEF)-like protein
MSNSLNKGYVLVYCIITIIFIFVIVFFIGRYESSKTVHVDGQISSLEAQIDTSIQSYRLFSEYIYESLIDNDFVLEKMSLAANGTETEKDLIRDELYDYFEDDYENIHEYDFRQVHFHLPDSTSFLRMHKPDKYGDSLYDIRYSVRTVNEEHIFISGFEEGRIFNGYRFVYPLEYNGEHVGSVEVSIALSSVINVLSSIYERDYCFILREDVVNELVFVDELDNYSQSFISEDFLVDTATFDDTINHNLIPKDEIADFFSSINRSDLEDIDGMEAMGLIHEYNGKSYEVLLYPIENIEGENVAYFISISSETGYEELTSQFRFTLIIIAITYILILAFITIVIRTQILLKKISYTDKLTNIDNRRKFEIDFKREMSHLRKALHDVSIIMFDIDHFKLVNDTYGHDAGDEVLSSIALLVRTIIRKDDYFSRYGGEEFIAMLIGSSSENATKKAEEIRKQVEDYDFGKVGKVTVSLGVYYMKDANLSYEDSIKAVDQAMYYAKEHGRNSVVNYTDIETEKKIKEDYKE